VQTFTLLKWTLPTTFPFYAQWTRPVKLFSLKSEKFEKELGRLAPASEGLLRSWALGLLRSWALGLFGSWAIGLMGFTHILTACFAAANIEDGPYGGDGGSAWTDGGAVHLNGKITSIRIRSASRVDSMQVKYGDTWGLNHGGGGGDEHVFNLSGKDTIWVVNGMYFNYIYIYIHQSFSDPAISSDLDSDCSPKFGLGLGLGLKKS
jgi:hypothetical protein